MFNPTREQVRDMFFEAWRKYRAGEMLVGIETIAVDVILAHPEYHEMLCAPQRYRERDYSDGANPFLHMSLHLAFEEQLSIDQPPGVARRFQDHFYDLLGSGAYAARGLAIVSARFRSSTAPSELMMIGTRQRAQLARSRTRRSLVLCTM